MANLTGTLFTDLNGNGAIDIGELSTTLAGWQVYVDYNGDGTWQSGEAISAVTGANGQYTITGILNGTYKVRTIAPDSSWTVSIPNSPSDTFGTYRVIDFQTNGNFLNGVNFENANIPNPSPALADNASLTVANQKWSSLGFKFWLDNDKDFIPDVQPGEGGGTMFVEERAGAVRRSQAEIELSAFVNDRLAGNFGDTNRLNKNGKVLYDVEDPTRYTPETGLGQYFLRGGGLYAPNNTTIPTLLIEYTTPTSAASGWIWDIDTTWLEQQRGEFEQWRVEAFDANKNAIDIDPNSANTYIDSPIGQSAWLLQGNTWVDNPNSLDGRHWEWSFNLNDANVSFVRISYIGTKGVGVNGATPLNGPDTVGLAFDRFQAFPGMPNFGAYQPATIGDYVWADANSNGIQDIGEAAVAGVTVSLLDENGNPVLDSNNNPITATTDANGKYSFNVAPGTYSVKFSNLPAGFTGFTTADVNGNGNDTEDSDANSSGLTSSVTVESGETNNTLDAGLVPESPQDLPVSIGNFVWSDTNGNGIQDDGVNSGIAGVTVNLKTAGTDGIIGNGDDTTISTQQTEADGSYLFDNLNPGSYYVEFVQPNTGYTGFTTPDAGADTVDSDANVTTGRTGLINLSSGENDLTVDAGLLPNQPVSIGNFVWEDSNGNGVQDTGEQGIAGATVQLFSGSTLINTFTTGSNGAYNFNNLPPGTYSVSVTAPSGYTATATGQGTPATDSNPNGSSTTLTSGQSDDTIDFGFYKPVSIGNFVWEDSNGNGVQDTGEQGIAGATVQLFSGSTLINTFTTGSNGAYNFNNLPPGTYSVSVTAPSGYTATATGQGTPTTDSNINGSSTTLTSGQSDDTIDFGFYKPASIGNFVWLDSNGDGKQTTGENGIPNVTVKLLGSDQTTVITSDVTSSTGFYQFTNLAPGVTYYVQFIPPTGTNGFTTANVSSNTFDTIDSDAGAGGITGPIVLTSGQYNDTIDAGFLSPPPPPSQYKLGDKVWSDTDQDGLQDTGEAGIGGITVRLLNSTGTKVLQTATTNSQGLYSFTVNNGTYRVEFAPSSSSYGFTVANIGNNGFDEIDSDADVLTGRTGTVTIAGADNLTVDAGLYIRPGTLEGKTLGYWKNNGIRQGQWELTVNPYSSPAGQPYKTTDSYETIFGVTLPGVTKTSADSNGNGTVTLLEALNANGNTDSENLLRQSTAALLNSAHPRLDYYYSIGEVLNRTKAAFLTAGTSDDNALATQFDVYNNKEGNIMA